MKFGATQAYKDAINHIEAGTKKGWIQIIAGSLISFAGMVLIARGSNWHGKALTKCDDIMGFAEFEVPSELEEELMTPEENLED